MKTDKQRIKEIEDEVTQNIKNIQQYTENIESVLAHDLSHLLDPAVVSGLKRSINESSGQLFMLGKIQSKIQLIKN